ncbi:MAG TPA: LuxR C-terminal-related transcriptional regulator [Aldersonia sp.]
MASVWPLTGRAEELELIAGSVGSDGAAGVVIAGAAGVGKTRLAREAFGAARRRGRRCRWYVATNSARSVPLAAFAETVDAFGADRLRRVQEVIGAVTRTDSPAPVVVGIDDAHLLDDQSALVVHQLVRRRLATVVATLRTGERAPDAITALWKEELLPRLDLQPLSREETAALLESVLGGPVESSSADRIWTYTRGNPLYLRQLLADDLASGRIFHRSGLWLWECDLEISPTLAELVETTIGRQPTPMKNVLDVVAVADPVELSILADITDPAAVDDVEAAGLITIDTETVPPVARLAHPMFGEARRARAGTMRLRHLRGLVATELGKVDTPDLIQTVRRAVLVLDSDLPPDPRMLMDASVAALRLMDPTSAERLARRAVETGGGRAAEVMHMGALANCDRIGDALNVISALIAAAASENDRVFLTIGRAAILARNDADEANNQLVGIRDAAAGCGLRRPYHCVAAILDALRSRPRDAVEAATAALSEPGWLNDTFELLAVVGLVCALGDLGHLDAIPAPAERGYELARTSLDSPTLRYPLGLFHIDALHLGGRIAEAQQVADRLAQEPTDFPYALTYRALCEGLTAIARGDLGSASKWFREVMATGAALESIGPSKFGQLWFVIVVAMSGDHATAGTLLAERDPYRGSDRFLVHAQLLAQAWVRAAGGVLSEAITLVRDSATCAQRDGCPAWEVLCLQTAAQFGDPTVAGRLTELASIVQGPRAVAAAAHAVALRDRDGARLRASSGLYEAFGDRIAAADAAAQAAVVFRETGFRGAALTATAISRRLADETGGDTPALRANATPIPWTRRQREIIALAASGLANREIAERLVMSVRTVEGHLLKASQRTGVNSREELVALLQGKSADHKRSRRFPPSDGRSRAHDAPPA